MTNELFERELRNTTINGISLADYINENYIVIAKTGAFQEQLPCDKCRNNHTSICGNCKEYDEYEPCCDLIRRQAAIDAFERFIHELGIEDKPYNYGEMALSAKNVPPITQKPIECDDVISRQAVLEMAYDMSEIDGEHFTEPHMIVDVEDIQKLPPVTQKSETVTEFADRCHECGARYGKLLKQRSGHWIGHREHCENLGVMPSGLGAYEWCSNCDCGIDVREWHRNNYNYCPNCGAKMTESEE